MAEFKETPYVCHVFVCTNDRKGARRSCADSGSVELRAALKQQVADRGLRGKVRVSSCGCMGRCEEGPNVMLYPQKEWLAEATLDDVEVIMERVEEAMS
jgi:(2Fe-2S) ferredoxin